MRTNRASLLVVAGMLGPAPLAAAEVRPAPPLANWEAPAEWTPAAASLPTSSLSFVGIVPCRMADTRDTTLSPGYGPPALTAGSLRNFFLTGRCGIPDTALAVSANVTAVNPAGPGFLLIRPTDGPSVLVSTLNFIPGQTTANGAVIPLGTGGAASFVAGVTSTELIIDVNGYYVDGGGVTTVNTLSGDVTLQAGSNVSITPSGNTLTIAATPGSAGVKTVNTLSGDVTLQAGSNVSITPSGNTLTFSAVPGGGGGDITGVLAGSGLSGGGTVGDVTLAVDTALVQARVSGSCAAGQSIRVVNPNGTVVCEADDVGTGTVTSVGAGAGLTGGPITTSGTLAVNFAGAGTAATASRSDHDHFGQTWSGGGLASGLHLVSSTAGTGAISGQATGPTNGIGVLGASSAVDGFGVFGSAISSTGVNYGVYGRASSPSGFAGYFAGPVSVEGDVTLGGQLTTLANATISASDVNATSIQLTNKRFCALVRMQQVGVVTAGTNFYCSITQSGSTFTLWARASAATHTVTCEMSCF